MKRPFISVVIPAYNEEQYLSKTLESLKKQDYTGNFEVIVVDNNSRDHTAQIGKNYGAKVIRELQKGVQFARQTGFAAARGQIIASTDADTIVPTNWLTTLAGEFAKNPDAVCVSGMFTFYDGSTLTRILTWLFNYPSFVIFGWHSAANMAVWKVAFIKSGGFDSKAYLSEDSELAKKLKKYGKVYILPRFKVQTSARRFNQLGLLGGLYNYTANYIKFKTKYKKRGLNFKPGSEVISLGFWPKLAIHTVVIITITSAFLGGIFEIKPVRAQVARKQREFSHHVPHVYIPKIEMPAAHGHSK